MRISDWSSDVCSSDLPATFVRETSLPYPVSGAVRFDNQAQFHPRKYLLPVAEAIAGDGSFVFKETRVLDAGDGSPCSVATDKGLVTAGDVIVATQIPLSAAARSGGQEGVRQCSSRRSAADYNKNLNNE